MNQLPLLPPAPVMSIKIIVPGEPVPKGRPRTRICSPRFKVPFIHFYQDAETEAYEKRVAAEARLIMMGRGLLLGALELRALAYVPIPRSWSEKKQAQAIEGIIMPISRPDSDNFLKCASDSLNGVVYRDDAQIVKMSVEKWYSEQPRLEIEIFAA